ncbi:hypothetical protein LCGC14_0363910 [marine sediment metagenome]|uniref:Uncharacterized protein n=1 Tax=marine sediment metagenome TaxID=412755 RepID=A0A0F9TQ23_9ZZZZ
MIVWYKEANGDYLAVDTEGEGYAGMAYARSAAIDGLPTSMSTGSVSQTYLEECCAIVPVEQVPEDWVKWANMEPLVMGVDKIINKALED